MTVYWHTKHRGGRHPGLLVLIHGRDTLAGLPKGTGDPAPLPGDKNGSSKMIIILAWAANMTPSKKPTTHSDSSG